jgi:hypothetical protein
VESGESRIGKIMKNEIMSFAGKWMELKIIMLSEINQVQRPGITYFHSFVEPRAKTTTMVMTMIVGHECIYGGLFGESVRGRKGHKGVKRMKYAAYDI